MLEPYSEKASEEKIPFVAEDVISLLTECETATAKFDVDRAEIAAKKLLTYECDKELSEQLINLSTLVNDLDYDEASDLASRIKDVLC